MTARTLVLSALLSAALVSPASAADFIPNILTDGDDGSCDVSNCTLREAIDIAGANDRVLPPAGTYTLTDGELVLADDTLLGAGARTTTIVADEAERAVLVNGGTNTISGVTITGGEPVGEAGGGILLAPSVTLTILDSTIANNFARDGGGIANQGGTLTIERSTIRDNASGQPTFEAEGGGIHISGGHTTLNNSTVSGNRVQSGESQAFGGGVFVRNGAFIANYSTIAANVAISVGSNPGFGSAIAVDFLLPSVTVSGSILAGEGPDPLCFPGTPTGTRNIFTDASCGGPVSDPRLGVLANNGGPTDTHAIDQTSPALNAGTSCPSVDQRMESRLLGCDIGAYENNDPVTPGDLDVVTQVVNDNGGTAQPGDFQVHVRRLGVDHGESPAAGLPAPGQDYVLVSSLEYTVTGAPAAGYTATTGGDCAPDGSVVVGGGLKTCTVTFNENGSQPPSGGGPPPPPPPPPPPDDPPVAGESVQAEPSGTVKVRLPGTDRFVTLTEGGLLPVGTVVDATKGRVTIVSAGNQSAVFFDGIFKISQGTGAKPLTVLTLVEKLSCPAKKATVSAKGKQRRRLWGDGTGRFQVKGKHSAATVVGTRWLVEDTCTTTRTKVTKGKVSVRDFVRKKTVTVKAGKEYIAKARP